MRPRLLAVTFEAPDPAGAARFWAALLGREVVADPHGALLPGDAGQLGLRFVPGRPGRLGADRMHLHLTSADVDDQQRQVTLAGKLDGRHLDVGQRPEEGHIVLADPAGYAFCVIEPGNAYLAGCGPLGELTCDGNRAVGLFRSRRWTGRWSGTRTRRPRSSHRAVARSSPGPGRRRPPGSSRTGNASRSPRPVATSSRPSTSWSRSGPSGRRPARTVPSG